MTPPNDDRKTYDDPQWFSHTFWETITLEELSLYLQACPDINTRGDEGETPLHWAVASNNAEIIQAMLDAGANPDMCNTSGETPLHIAAKEDHVAAAKALIKANADVHIRDKTFGETPLHYAVDSGEIAAALLRAGAKSVMAENAPESAKDRGGRP